MQLNILGTGSSGNCYILQDKSEACIIEAGVPAKQVLKTLDYDPGKVTELLVSHEHGDHAKYKGDILKAVAGTYEGKIRRHCNFQITPFLLNHDVDNVGYVIQKGDVKLMYASDTRSITAKAKGLTHLLVECNFSEEILSSNIANGKVNAYLANRIRNNHLSLERLKHYLSIIDKSCLQKIVLCHLSDHNSNARQFQKEIEKESGVPVYIAEKNQTIEL